MTTAAATPTLLERERSLEALRTAFAETLGGAGRLVLVEGEAGVGKTALVRAFCTEARDRARILQGACDPLATPRPLGPVVDVAATVGGELARTADDGGAPAVLPALIAELRRRPTVLVLEDLHWADEATLDLLRLLGRRVQGTRALVVGTLRDDELDASHPLRLTLGGLATAPAVRRLQIEPLSVSAVRVLAVLRDVDAAELHRRTGGNPFFVTEVLAADGEGVPASVRDAVLFRTARLPSGARRLLEAVAVFPGEAELWLLERVVPNELAELGTCLESGVLVDSASSVRFRHELARVAIEGTLDTLRRRELHRAMLAELGSRAGSRPDTARLAHHAEAAGDADAVLRHARTAGEDAAARGAHRESADQYARALRHAGGLGDWELSVLLERHAHECFVTGRTDDALSSREQARDRYHVLGDIRKEGVQLCWLSRLFWFVGRRDDAERAARDAVALLEPLPAGPELALAYHAMASRRALALELAPAREWGGRAVALAERLGEREIVARTSIAVGVVEALAGLGSGRLRRGLAIADELGNDELVGLARGNLAVVAVRQRDWAEADRILEAGLEHAVERDLDADRTYLLAWRAVASLERCSWDAAAADIDAVLRDPAPPTVVRASAQAALGLLRARRGDPDVWRPLDEALGVAVAAAEHQKRAPLAVNRVEAALLSGDEQRAREELAGFELGLLTDRWVVGQLAVWRRRLGMPGDVTRCPEPFSRELAGDHRAAFEWWRRRDAPYDAAMALAWADDERSQHEAHEQLLALGAAGAAAFVAGRLRRGGARAVRRGPRKTTRANVANLTRRELDVLQLVATGMRNHDIAARLFVSRRTVDHHVSAILRKLGARTRGEAAAAAARLGLLEDR